MTALKRNSGLLGKWSYSNRNRKLAPFIFAEFMKKYMINAVNIVQEQLVETEYLSFDSEPRTYNGDDRLSHLKNISERYTYAVSYPQIGRQ